MSGFGPILRNAAASAVAARGSPRPVPTTKGPRVTSTDPTADRHVLLPGDAAYADELAGFQTGFAHAPAVVFAASGGDDVVAAVTYAADAGLPVEVQATGHGLPGDSRGAVLISTRRMDDVTVDAAARTVRVGAGARWGQVVEAAAPHGLAPLNGSSPGVGVVSYTLGGGIPTLAREFGYAADHVTALEIVTADGAPRRVTADSDPELFWALRGGGHGLGVVTALETALVPVARLYGGALAFDGRAVDPATVLRTYARWTRTVPDTLTSSLTALVYPDLDAMPPHLRGRYLVSVQVAFTGDAEEGERLVAPLRAIGPALTDSLREMPYTESHTIHSDPPYPHAYYGDNAMLSDLDVDATAEVLTLAGPRAPMMCVFGLRHLGGALAGSPDVPNAVPHRDASFLMTLLSPLDGTDREAVRAHFAPAFAGLAPWTTGRSRNFSFAGGEVTQGLYDEQTQKRLAGCASQYDPANLFGRHH